METELLSNDVARDLTGDGTRVTDTDNSSVRIVDISHDTTLPDNDNGETFDCLESVGEGVEDGCVVCGNSMIDTCPQLLTCLHSACNTCIMFNSQTITCPRCKQTCETCHSVPVSTARASDTTTHVPHVSECLLEMARDQINDKIPKEEARVDNLLRDLQDENDNTRRFVQETYESYRYC